MNNREYFDFLCKIEAGETIYKTVENVSGVFQMRPAFEPTDFQYSDRYVLEDPYSVTRENTLDPWESFVQPFLGRYDFLETWVSAIKDNPFVHNVNDKIDFKKIDSQFVRFYRDINAHPNSKDNVYVNRKPIPNPKIVNGMPVNEINAHYGYTWRGLGGANLREQGIAGGEQIVVDLMNGEVLALRRSFVFSDLSARGRSVWWMGAVHCSKQLTAPTDAFVKRVLRPIHPAQISN
jgi:hypothetical protein